MIPFIWNQNSGSTLEEDQSIGKLSKERVMLGIGGSYMGADTQIKL